MINANELRLGNIVSYKGIIGKVTWIQQNCITIEYPRQDDLSNGSMVSPELLDGVEITGDILIKLGFENKNTQDQIGYYLDINNRTLCWCYSDIISIEFKPNQMDEYNYTLMDIKCKYTHELQNIYQALSNKELDTTKLFD